MPGKKSKEKLLTFTDLVKFFHEVLKPEFDLLATKEMLNGEVQSLRSEINGRFDDLYKKF